MHKSPIAHTAERTAPPSALSSQQHCMRTFCPTRAAAGWLRAGTPPALSRHSQTPPCCVTASMDLLTETTHPPPPTEHLEEFVLRSSSYFLPLYAQSVKGRVGDSRLGWSPGRLRSRTWLRWWGEAANVPSYGARAIRAWYNARAAKCA